MNWIGIQFVQIDESGFVIWGIKPHLFCVSAIIRKHFSTSVWNPQVWANNNVSVCTLETLYQLLVKAHVTHNGEIMPQGSAKVQLLSSVC